MRIADAINSLGGTGLWDEEDGFYYDQMYVDGQRMPLAVRSMVGLIPLFAVEVLNRRSDRQAARLPQADGLVSELPPGPGEPYLVHGDAAEATSHGRRLLAIPSRQRLERVLRYLLDENEFLSPYGIRSLSKYYRDNPYVFRCRRSGVSRGIRARRVDIRTLFGGNSNWRGPIWFPVNYLLIEALERYHHFYGDTLQGRVSDRFRPLDEPAAGRA